DSTSRAPPTTACAMHPIRGSGPVCAATAAASVSSEPRKWGEANSTANEGDRSPSDALASTTARPPASAGSAASTRDAPACTCPGYGPSEDEPGGICASRTQLAGKGHAGVPALVRAGGD